jgi:hypothetical protein
MKMAKVGVLFDQKTAARRREQGINVFRNTLGKFSLKPGSPFFGYLYKDQKGDLPLGAALLVYGILS